jgi:hypothetical protein
MPIPECPREQEVVDAVLTGDGVGASQALSAHVAHCEICRDLVEIVALLRDERGTLPREGGVPSAGQVWWRSAVRARVEATRAVWRPLTWMLGVVAACATGLAVALIGMLWPAVRGAARQVELSAWMPVPAFGQSATMTWVGGPLALGALALIVLTPVALYLALSDDR